LKLFWREVRIICYISGAGCEREKFSETVEKEDALIFILLWIKDAGALKGLVKEGFLSMEEKILKQDPLVEIIRNSPLLFKWGKMEDTVSANISATNIHTSLLYIIETGMKVFRLNFFEIKWFL